MLDRLITALRRREVFAARSTSPCVAKMPWPSSRTRSRRPSRPTAAALPTNHAVTITTTAGKPEPVLSPLERLDESASLLALRDQNAALLPRIDLSALLLEVHQRTGFLDAFTHLSERDATVDDLAISLCAPTSTSPAPGS